MNVVVARKIGVAGQPFAQLIIGGRRAVTVDLRGTHHGLGNRPKSLSFCEAHH